MKKKCIKCGIYFKQDAQWHFEEKDLCFNCRFIWRYVKTCLQSLSAFKKLNRKVAINLDNIQIAKYINKKT
jgi:hypothetical protein